MDEVRIGTLILQPRRQLLADGNRIPLNRKSLEVLSVLAEANGELVTKNELMEAVWPRRIVEENSLQAHIVAVRKALGGEAHRLSTVHGFGYKLEIGRNRPPFQDETTVQPLTGGSLPGFDPRKISVILVIAALAFAAIVVAWSMRDGGSLTGSDGKIVVYPFASSGQNPEAVALATGVTDELINRLRLVPELSVITGARPGEKTPPARGATMPRVDGNVHLENHMLRVSARLTDRNGKVVWSETYSRPFADLFQVEDGIARSIASELSVSLDVGSDSTAFGGTHNPQAFVNFVRGTALAYHVDRSRPVSFLERAVELDPGYVRAYSALSIAYGFSRNLVATRSEDQALLYKQGQAAANAMRLKPDLWFSQASQSLYRLGQRDLVSADASLHRALDLDPANDPVARDVLADITAEFGRVRKAVELKRSKALIDPYYENDVQLIYILMFAGLYDEAKRRFSALTPEALEAQPGVIVHVYWAYLLSGDLAGARKLAARGNLFAAYRNVPDFRFDRDTMPDLPPAELKLWADRIVGDGGRPALILLALLAAHYGHDATALDYLRLAFQRTGTLGYLFLWHPALANLRKTDGFEQLVTELGLVAAWRKNGDWGDYCAPVSATRIACR